MIIRAKQRLYKISMNIRMIAAIRAPRLKWKMRYTRHNLLLKRKQKMNEIDC